jgi:hypothetical protein
MSARYRGLKAGLVIGSLASVIGGTAWFQFHEQPGAAATDDVLPAASVAATTNANPALPGGPATTTTPAATVTTTPAAGATAAATAPRTARRTRAS